jgi:hypothetical protein
MADTKYLPYKSWLYVYFLLKKSKLYSLIKITGEGVNEAFISIKESIWTALNI